MYARAHILYRSTSKYDFDMQSRTSCLLEEIRRYLLANSRQLQVRHVK